MRTIYIYKASDSTLVESISGETMAIALRRAITLGERIRPQLQTDLYLRDCLGGLRAETRLRAGVVSTVKTK